MPTSTEPRLTSLLTHVPSLAVSCLAQGGDISRAPGSAMNQSEQWRDSHGCALLLAPSKPGQPGLPGMTGCREGPCTSSSRVSSPTHREVLLYYFHRIMIEPFESFPLLLKSQLHAAATCDLALPTSSRVLSLSHYSHSVSAVCPLSVP